MRALLGGILTLTLGLAVSAVSASPSVAEAASEPQRASIDSTQLKSATQTAAQALRSRSANPQVADVAQKYLDKQARSGRLLDASDVKVASVADPFGNGQIRVAWDGSRQPERIDVAVSKDANANDGMKAIGVMMAEAPDAATSSQQGGAGFDGAFNVKDMFQMGHECVELWWDPEYWTGEEPQDHNATSCYEKYQDPTTRKWIYNRWAVFQQAEGPTNNPRTVDFTLRSRPWKGYEDRVESLYKWTPAGGQKTCEETMNVSLSFPDFAGVEIPIHQCTSTSVLPDATTKAMGIDFNGEETGQLALDFGAAIYAKSADEDLNPIYADYLWAQVDWGISNKKTLLWNEDGW
ncbi:hypothetical protein AB0L65_61310 [Nonomuraea sp. NPDC052116]|uniref:hypothetical protein n=1 Tax=Nonomuraea sp. NPDC052116 TaxID=3155665 RepID=UPI00341207D2